MNLRKAAEMALNYFESAYELDSHEIEIRDALRKALAQPQPVQFKCTVVDDGHPNGVPLSQWGRQPEQEPVAWVNKDGWFRSHKDADVAFRAYAFPLYAGPKKKEWIGLADDELPEGATYEFDRGVRWAEAKLKEKNNG